jgi:predicted PurR-regulated permease PerM
MANSNNKTEIDISNKTLLRITLFILAFLFLISFVSRLTNALQLIFISGFLAVALNPVVSWIGRQLRIKSRLRATAIAYMFVLTFLIGGLWIVVPPFISETINFAKSIPLNIDDLQNQDTPMVRFINNNNLSEQYTSVVSDVKDNLEGVGATALTTATTVGGALLSLVTVLVLTFMMLVEGPGWAKKWVAMQSPAKVTKKVVVLKGMYRMITGYVNGQLIIASVAAMFALVALLIASTVIGVTVNAIALAFIVGLIGLIPMIGNTLAAVIVVIVCLFVSLPLAITMAIFFLIYQQVENATFQPYVQAKYNELTPLIVFVSALVGVHFAGFLGALIAIPIAGCIKIFVTEYYGDKLEAQNNQKFSVEKK